MKKNYIKPEVRVVIIAARHHMLVTSGENPMYGTTSTYDARRGDFDFDDFDEGY